MFEGINNSTPQPIDQQGFTPRERNLPTHSTPTSSQHNTTSEIAHTDPLRDFEASLSRELFHPKRRLSRPIADEKAVAHGTTTLEEQAALQRRMIDGTLRHDDAEYSRYYTPISRRLESKLAALEGGEAALVFNSGMAAIDTTVRALLPNSRAERAHFIVGSEGYRQTNAILFELEQQGFIDLTVLPMANFVAEIPQHIRSHTRGIIFETPSNPYQWVIDVREVKDSVLRANSKAVVVADTTFASPVNQRALEQGADLVISSLTKYVSGNNRALAGAVIGSAAQIRPIAERRGRYGGICCDDTCLTVEEGLPSLEERVARANENGMHVATLLERNPNVERVWYPGLSSHANHDVACKQMKGFGGVVSFLIDARGDYKNIAAFTNALVAAGPEGTFVAPSFGGPSPLISCVTVVSHFQQNEAERKMRGIPYNLMRLYTGIGSPQELTDMLQAGFTALESRRDKRS